MILDEHGFIDHRVFDDGRIVAVVPLTFGRGRITVGWDYTFIQDAY